MTLNLVTDEVRRGWRIHRDQVAKAAYRLAVVELTGRQPSATRLHV